MPDSSTLAIIYLVGAAASSGLFIAFVFWDRRVNGSPREWLAVELIHCFDEDSIARDSLANTVADDLRFYGSANAQIILQVTA